MKKCLTCGIEYKPRIAESKYCSRKCHAISLVGKPSWNKRSGETTRNCEVCGSKFFLRADRIQTARFCSRSCNRKGQMGSVPWNRGITGMIIAWNKGRKFTQFSRENNHFWKDGTRRGRGYTYILMADHPFAAKDGYIAQHRLIVEKHIGRYLLKGEVVHHINEIREDNRIENLMLFRSPGVHSNFHKGHPMKSGDIVFNGQSADILVSA